MTWMPNDISIWTSGLRWYYDKSLLQLGLHTLLQRTAAQTLQTAPSHGPRPFGSTCPDEMLMFSHCGKCMKMCELCSPRVSRRTLKLKASSYPSWGLNISLVVIGGLNTCQLPILATTPWTAKLLRMLCRSNHGHGLAMEAHAEPS